MRCSPSDSFLSERVRARHLMKEQAGQVTRRAALGWLATLVRESPGSAPRRTTRSADRRTSRAASPRSRRGHGARWLPAEDPTGSAARAKRGTSCTALAPLVAHAFQGSTSEFISRRGRRQPVPRTCKAGRVPAYSAHFCSLSVRFQASRCCYSLIFRDGRAGPSPHVRGCVPPGVWAVTQGCSSAA
jgi:hypothetical protein